MTTPTSTLQLSLSQVGGPLQQNTQISFPPVTNTGSPGTQTLYALASGSNTIAIPSGTVQVLIYALGPLTLKFNSGDTGFIMSVVSSPGAPISFPVSGYTSFILNVPGASSATIFWI